MSHITTIIAAIGNNKHFQESVQSAIPLSQEIVVINMGIDLQELKSIGSISNVRIVDHAPVSHIELLREESKQFADSEYILFLDPDEVISETLASHLKEQYEQYDTIKIPRKNIIMGRWIEHARWWPDYQTRLFKKDAATWPTEIHKQPVTTGKELVLEPKEEYSIHHYNYTNLDEFLLKMIRYARAEAKTKHENNEEYTLSKALTQGTSEFISRYFAADGYKDGMHGFALSFLQLMYYPLVYFYLWELIKYKDTDSKSIINESYSFTQNLLISHIHWMIQKKLIPKSRSLHKRIATFLMRI